MNTTIHEEECGFNVAYFSGTTVVFLEEVFKPDSNWGFSAPSGTCGFSFLNSSGTIDPFVRGPGLSCVTLHSNLISSTRIQLHFRGIPHDIYLKRIHPRNTPLMMPSELAMQVTHIGPGITLIFEVKGTDFRCTTFPLTFINSLGTIAELQSTESVCGEALFAVYSARVSLDSMQKFRVNQTHSTFIADIGGGSSTCGDFLQPCLSVGANFSITLEYEEDVFVTTVALQWTLVATLVPFFLVILSAVVEAFCRRSVSPKLVTH